MAEQRKSGGDRKKGRNKRKPGASLQRARSARNKLKRINKDRAKRKTTLVPGVSNKGVECMKRVPAAPLPPLKALPAECRQ